MSEALVFAIEEFSTFDGPGIRTTVFLKGCPLRCEWCHNPEGQSYENEIMKSQFGCLKCGECLKFAEADESNIKYTEKSISVCQSRLLRYAAERFTPTELVDKLSPNLKILNSSNGGVTFSGGEPLSNAEFLIDCLKLLEGKTHRALQTCGFCAEDTFKNVLENVDFVLFDIKLIDEVLHKKYTGVSNTVILKNFETLVKSNVSFIVRTPLIPTVTDTIQNLTEIACLLLSFGIKEIDLLPYNKVSGGKYASVGREYTPSFNENIKSNPHFKIFEQHGIKANLL